MELEACAFQTTVSKRVSSNRMQMVCVLGGCRLLSTVHLLLHLPLIFPFRFMPPSIDSYSSCTHLVGLYLNCSLSLVCDPRHCLSLQLQNQSFNMRPTVTGSLDSWNIVTLSQFLSFHLFIYKCFLIIYTLMRSYVLIFPHSYSNSNKFFLGPVYCVIQECLATLQSFWYWDLLLMDGFHFLVLLFDLTFYSWSLILPWFEKRFLPSLWSMLFFLPVECHVIIAS